MEPCPHYLASSSILSLVCFAKSFTETYSLTFIDQIYGFAGHKGRYGAVCGKSMRLRSELDLGLRSNSFNIDSANIYVGPLMCQTLHCVTLGGSLNFSKPRFPLLVK